jgi:predicted Zn finger-like uncharacterized protein
MKLTCPVCEAVYNIDPDKLADPVARVACKKCGTTLFIDKETGGVRAEREVPEGVPEFGGSSGPSPADGPSILSGSSAETGSRDTLALGVVVAALIALVVTAFLAFRNFDTDFLSNPIDSVGRAVKNLEEGIREKLEGPKRDVPPHIKRARDSRRHLSRGIALFKKKRYEKAIEEYDMALRTDPKNPEAYFWKGRTLAVSGRPAEALTDLIRAVELKPDHADAHDNLGWIYSNQGEYEKSIHHLTRSIDLKPNNAWAYYTRGGMYFKKGDMEKALQDAKKSCDLGYRDGCKIYEKFKEQVR